MVVEGWVRDAEVNEPSVLVDAASISTSSGWEGGCEGGSWREIGAVHHMEWMVLMYCQSASSGQPAARSRSLDLRPNGPSAITNPQTSTSEGPVRWLPRTFRPYNLNNPQIKKLLLDGGRELWGQLGDSRDHLAQDRSGVRLDLRVAARLRVWMVPEIASTP